MKFLIQKKSKLVCLATATLMTSGILFFSGINADAEEVVSNSTQTQMTSSDNNAVYNGELLIQERG